VQHDLRLEAPVAVPRHLDLSFSEVTLQLLLVPFRELPLPRPAGSRFSYPKWCGSCEANGSLRLGSYKIVSAS
jgi:hypothetical protein